MDIRVDDLSSPEIVQLLGTHLQDMALHSPPESVHALDLEGLRKPEVTFWSAWQDAELLGCGAIKELDSRHGEIKSMRTVSSHLRKGVRRDASCATFSTRPNGDLMRAAEPRNRLDGTLCAGAKPLCQFRVQAMRPVRRLRRRSVQRFHDREILRDR